MWKHYKHRLIFRTYYSVQTIEQNYCLFYAKKKVGGLWFGSILIEIWKILRISHLYLLSNRTSKIICASLHFIFFKIKTNSKSLRINLISFIRTFRGSLFNKQENNRALFLEARYSDGTLIRVNMYQKYLIRCYSMSFKIAKNNSK